MIARLLATTGLILLAGTALAAPAKPKPATALQITNARDVPATAVEIGVGETSVKLAKPLAPKGRTNLKLPKMNGCLVSVAAVFADESVVELDEFDVCKEKTVRFTD
ncbi:MAG TPA: hypothetical protein VIL09_10940 [Microvirga sp.]|jgi:hypothetical protein